MNNNTHSLIKTFFLIGSTIFAHGTLGEIEEVLVTDHYRATSTSPVSYLDISAEEIESQNLGQEPSFILQNTPSINVYSDSGASNGYSYFRLRGIDQTRINMTLDGAPLNEPEDQGVYFSNFPDFFSSLESVQIQRGVGISQNGTASYGGSLQFTSKDVSENEKNIEANYGSFATRRITADISEVNDAGYSWYLRASDIHSDGFKERSANDSRSLFHTGAFSHSSGDYKITAFTGTQENQMAWLGVPRSVIDENRRANANSEEGDKFSQSFLVLNHKKKMGDIGLATGVYLNGLHGNYDFDLNNFLGLSSTDEMYNYRFKSRFYGAFSNASLKLGNKVEATFGAHLNNYCREHIGSERSEGVLYVNEGCKNEQSIFVKSRYENDGLTLFADLQYRAVDFSYEGAVAMDDQRWNFINPMVGASFEVSPKVVAYYSIGKTQREPTRNDMFGGNDDLTATEDGMPELSILDEESVVNHELGLRYSGENMQADLNYYYMDFEDEITLIGQFGPNGLALNESVDSSVRQGIEATMGVNFNTVLSTSTMLSLSDNKIKDAGESFEPILSPDLIFSQGVALTLSDLSMGVNYRYQSKAYVDFANSETIHSFGVIDMHMGYQFENVALTAYVHNVTDKEYFANGLVDFDGQTKYFVGAPINYSIKLKVAL